MLRWSFVALALFGFSACGDPCIRSQALNTGFRERHGACFDQGTVAGQEVDLKHCQASLKLCSNADLAAVDSYLRCVETLPVCKADTKADWNNQFLSCTTGMSTLTAGCFSLVP